eukprot:jgi/Bigna1/86254/estExt_fgenesh1_pg.C_90125
MMELEGSIRLQIFEFLDISSLSCVASTCGEFQRFVRDNRLEDIAAEVQLQKNHWNRIEADLGNEGYRDGLDQGYESSLQEGFDRGYRDATVSSLEEGFIRGCLTGASIYLDKNTKHCDQKTLKRLRTFLVALGGVPEEERKSGIAGVSVSLRPTRKTGRRRRQQRKISIENTEDPTRQEASLDASTKSCCTDSGTGGCTNSSQNNNCRKPTCTTADNSGKYETKINGSRNNNTIKVTWESLKHIFESLKLNPESISDIQKILLRAIEKARTAPIKSTRSQGSIDSFNEDCEEGQFRSADKKDVENDSDDEYDFM